ncbi:STAS domain-containing protein [Jhaorihella thermophila]|uniref:Anti-sigma factor antagonist n=1 Tax=Jhaorihella thermophila TaxID=488547 RepID=A0A1H5X9V6_9RHOB|nr:STAS domain-containing protein [Jhaorihella thermophila]SEG08541.1 anti-sigma B factor antagonist [Jhaorihella thermophila]
MELSSEDTAQARIITVHADRIDAAGAIEFKEKMRSAVDEGPERVVLDLTSVDFIDSSGLGAIVATMKMLGQGRRLDLAGLTPLVEKVFRLTRMDTIFRLYPDRETALAVTSE